MDFSVTFFVILTGPPDPQLGCVPKEIAEALRHALVVSQMTERETIARDYLFHGCRVEPIGSTPTTYRLHITDAALNASTVDRVTRYADAARRVVRVLGDSSPTQVVTCRFNASVG